MHLAESIKETKHKQMHAESRHEAIEYVSDIDVDTLDLVSRIKDIQYTYKSVFDQLRWHLRSVYALNYESLLNVKGSNTDDLEYFAEDIDSEVERLLSKYCLTKAKTYGTRAFSVKPTVFNVDADMSLKEFTENNFLPETHGSTFAHLLSYMEADEISLQLTIMSYNGVMTDSEIEQEFLVLESFIEDVRDFLRSFVEFRYEFKEISDGLFDEYVSSYI